MISAFALAIALALPGQGRSPEAGTPAEAKGGAWTPLFNGRDLTGWYTFLQKHGKNSDPDRVVTIEDGSIHLYKHAADGSEVVMGYIGTEKEYGNYHLRFRYRWGDKKFAPRYALKRDAGLYYHILGADAVWPRSLQFQIEATNVGDLIALHGFQLDSTVDPKTRAETKATFLPAGQGGEAHVLGGKGIAYQGHLAGDHERDGWNTVEVIAQGDTVTHRLNGRLINQGTKVRLVDPDQNNAVRPISRGRIALEIEAAEIYFRDVEIRSLDEASGTPR